MEKIKAGMNESGSEDSTSNTMVKEGLTRIIETCRRPGSELCISRQRRLNHCKAERCNLLRWKQLGKGRFGGKEQFCFCSILDASWKSK